MKRSSQVALLLMGVGGVGAGAAALAPQRHCATPDGRPPATLAPSVPGKPAEQPCPPRRAWSSGRTTWSHWSTPIYGRRTGTSTVPATSRSGTGSRGGTTSRGGFGGTGHSISHSSSS